MLPTLAPSPLLDVGLAFIGELGKAMTAEQTAHVREILVRYLARAMSFQDCVAILFPVLGTAQPIEKLEAILRMPDVPLPHAPASVGLRSGPDCRAKSRPWTNYEDQRLFAAIHRFGLDAWRLIALFVGNGRSKSQCSQRWSRGLDPRISKDQWLAGEDDRLIDLVAICGEKCWTRVASELGNRCDVQCRYRYKQLQREDGFAPKRAAAAQKAKAVSVLPPARPVGRRHPRLPDPLIVPSTPLSFQGSMQMSFPGLGMMMQPVVGPMIGVPHPDVFMHFSPGTMPFYPQQQPAPQQRPADPKPDQQLSAQGSAIDLQGGRATFRPHRRTR
jgi:hypothetical protein